MPLPGGTRLGPYEITCAIGSGGMGDVYKARDTRLERDVAVKVLPESLTSDPDAVARFQREARAVAALSHPNIVGIFDIGSESGTWFVVTELLEGMTLREYLASGGLEAADASRIAREIARGLAGAHEKGIVHRDLKPENVFLTRGGGVKILDFGLARQLSLASAAATIVEPTLTTPGVVMGTVGYMAPEQVRGLQTDARADVFAFGAVFYEMLAGRRAFRGDTAADTMAAVVRDEPAELAAPGGVPAALSGLIRRCLAKDPKSRFASASDLVPALESLVHKADAPATTRGRSIVVLPFTDISPEGDNAFFADGLTEEIISDLSKIGDLRVISRTSSMQLKGRQHDLATIARDLNVHYVLEGSVRKAGDRLRITAQLVDTGTDAQIWSDKYNGTLHDIFEIQEQVARAIVSELKVKLTPDESREIARRLIKDPAAYECCLRARAGIAQFTESGLHAALDDVQRGLDRVGDNVLLLAAQGDVYWQQFNLGLTSDPAHLEKIASVARRLERLEGGAGHANRLLASVAVHAGDMREAVQRIELAVELEPADTLSLHLHAIFNVLAGHTDRAARSVARVAEIDPLQLLTHAIQAIVLWMSGQAEAALAPARRAYLMEPANPAATQVYAQLLAATGRRAEAVDVLDRLERHGAQGNWSWLCGAFRRALDGDAHWMRETMTPARRAWVSQDPQYPISVAEYFALGGMPDQAFEWLDHAIGRGSVNYPFYAQHDVFLEPLRADPRWSPLMARAKREWEDLRRM
jgi:serine/threonine protein kinase